VSVLESDPEVLVLIGWIGATGGAKDQTNAKGDRWGGRLFQGEASEAARKRSWYVSGTAIPSVLGAATARLPPVRHVAGWVPDWTRHAGWRIMSAIAGEQPHAVGSPCRSHDVCEVS
jgi:hypothetical protein